MQTFNIQKKQLHTTPVGPTSHSLRYDLCPYAACCSTYENAKIKPTQNRNFNLPLWQIFAKTQQVLHHQSQHPIFMKLRHIIPNIAVTEPVTNQQPKFTINTNLKTCQSLAAYTYQSLAEFFTQNNLSSLTCFITLVMVVVHESEYKLSDRNPIKTKKTSAYYDYSPFLAQKLPRGYKIHQSSSLVVAVSSSSSFSSFSLAEPSSALDSSSSSSVEPSSSSFAASESSTATSSE